MKTENYLKQIERFNRKIEFKLNELAELREMSIAIKSATSDDIRVKSGSPQNVMENTVIAIVEKENELQDLISDCLSCKSIIISQIEELEDVNEYTVLMKRYVENKSMKDIAESMSYSVKNIERIHKNAMENFEEMFKSEIKKIC